MAAGTVDVRTRDNQRHGMKRVDQIADEMDALVCDKSAFYNKFYENIWKAEDYGLVSEAAASVEESKETAKP